MKMMRRMVAARLLALRLAMPAQATPPSPDYVILYQEDFSGNAVNERDWTWRTGRRTGGPINGLNLKENVSVSGGMLHIAVRHNGRRAERAPATSARATSPAAKRCNTSSGAWLRIAVASNLGYCPLLPAGSQPSPTMRRTAGTPRQGLSIAASTCVDSFPSSSA